MYYSASGLLAIMILLIVNWDILHNFSGSYEKTAWNVYRRFLVAVLIYYICDVLWGIFESRKLSMLVFADTTVYFVAMAAGVLFWAEFTVSYLEENHAFGRALVTAGNILAGLIVVLSIINIFVPILFTVDGESVYRALPARYVLLACQILLLILISVYCFRSMLRVSDSSGKRGKYRTLMSFGMIMAFFLFAQLWFPYLPLYTIAYMLGTSLLHSFVANDEKEDFRRGLADAKRDAELKETITSLLDNMPGLTFTKDAKTGVYLACNQSFAEYAHKESPKGVVGLTDAQIFDKETAAHFVQDDKMALSISGPYVFFEDVPDAAGNQRQLQTTKVKYKDTAGRLCVLGMCQDVTDLVRIQHENAMTKEAYEKAVSTGLVYTHIAQTLARDYTDLFYVNCDSEEFIEYLRGEDGNALIETRRGLHFFSDGRDELAENVYPDDRGVFLQTLKRKTLMQDLKRNNAIIMTYRMTGAGGVRYVRMKISSMIDDDHFIIIGITDVDAEMRDSMAKSEALADALEAAEEASKAKTAFLSNMSHEIRSPMNAIIGLNTLALKKEGLDDDTRDYLEKTGGSARHLLALINDILDMNRIESGKVVLRKEKFSLRAVLEQVNAMFLSQCLDKGLTYECQIIGQLDEAYIGDEMKLKEVLINILSNAVKFTEAPGSVTLTVEKTAEYDGQVTLHFRVKDTGIGMDKDFIPKIFEPFSQEDGNHKTKYGSTGLGMAITKRIVEMMNGSISVDSQKGVGTEFDVAITMRSCDYREDVQTQPIDLQTLYVLVVDDDPIDAAHAKSVLEEVGIKTDTASSGEEALRMIEVQHTRHKPYNLVLMDWNMPGINGLKASDEIRKQYENESTVIVMTAYNWDDIQEEAHRVGVNSFLAKPLLASNVVEQIERIARQNNMNLFKEKKRADLVGRRILLAEDVKLNAEIMTHTLEIENIKVDHAENGRIAFELFKKSTPGTYAAILMDVRMPEMDGLEATVAIRALDREDAKRIPIIALTANAFDEDVQQSLQAGMNAHLSKPVESEHLIQTLGELIYEAEESSEV